MEEISDTGTINNISTIFGINQATTPVPNQANSIIQPTIDISPFAHPIANVLQSINHQITAGEDNIIIYTTPTNQNFYLTNFYIFVSQDNNGGNTAWYQLTVYVNGVKQILVYNTAFNVGNTIAYFYQVPLIIDAGTNITLETGIVFGQTYTLVSNIIGFTYNPNNYQGYTTSTGTG